MKTKIALIISAILLLSITGCPNCNPVKPEPEPTATQFVLFDDFSDGDNQTASAELGGYWYTFDDLTASINNLPGNCGSSTVWPMSENANIKYGYGIAPQFVMSAYVSPSEKPSGVASDYYARVSGVVNRSALNQDANTGYPWGFAGFGANLLEVDNGKKVPVNAAARKYERLVFWYKNGPSVSANTPWKVKLGTQAVVGSGPCVMGEGDNVPVASFTATNTWQKFDKAFSEFAPESGWGQTACGQRGDETICVPGAAPSYTDTYTGGGGSVPAAKYKCSAQQAMTALDAIQWQTGFSAVGNNQAFDLMIAEVKIIKGE
ncbi:MAG TPA: hypothetical protein P5511_06685 [Candidatus Goldiibacteriota bacterium]|nr:hypothetical protein [Candidatus Goldiibacteriota bacterium]